MKKLPLLPHVCQKIGFVFILPFMALGMAYMGWQFTLPWLDYPSTGHHVFNFSNNNFTDELAAVGVIVSLLLIAFSKEKVEDEAIQYFRLASLQWAVWVNYLVLVACILFCYGDLFFTIMTINLFTVLIIFIARFRYVFYQYNKMSS